MDPIDRTFLEGEDIRAAMTARDIGTVYRHLRRLGVSQRHIAQLTGQSPSEVSEILRGRQVRDVRVLERIADGLGVPRAWLGVSYGEEPTEESPAAEEVDEAMKRRTLIATATTAAVGEVLIRTSEPIELALPSGQVLPSRLGLSHVHAVRAVTEQLRGVARYYGGQADPFTAVSMVYAPWMEAPGPEAVKAHLAAALAELHTEAGYCCYDEGVDGTGHFTRALQLADQAGDACGMANAAWHAGLVQISNGHPNDALKLFQLGHIRLQGFAPDKPKPAPDDPRLPTLTAQLNRSSATAYAVMGGHDEATRYLAEANKEWEPRDAFERARVDFETATIQLHLGQLDATEHSAASAARTYREGNYRRGQTVAEIVLAEVHLRAGEPQGLTLAHHAIEQVKTLHSVAVRRELVLPLATALEARPDTDTRELARKARQVATTQI